MACLGHGGKGSIVQVDEEGHVSSELADEGEKDIGREDIGVGPLGRQVFQRLSVGDDKEQHRAQHPHDRSLEVPQFHALCTHPVHDVNDQI